MAVVIALSCVLMAIQYWTSHHAGFIVSGGTQTFLSDTMLFSRFGTGSELYLFLLPLIAALLGGEVVSVERHSRRMYAIVPRVGRRRYLNTSLCAGFLLGGLGGVSPLTLNMLLAAVMNPRLDFIDGMETDASGWVHEDKYVLISSTSWVYPLYRMNQVVCILFIIAVVFVISGLFALVAMGCSFFTKRRHIELLVPFLLNLLWWMLPALTNLSVPDQWSCIIFLFFSPPESPDLAGKNVEGLVLTVVLLSAMAAVLQYAERRRDVL